MVLMREKERRNLDLRVKDLIIDRTEILDKIIYGGLVEDFIDWLKRRGIELNEIKLEDVDYRSLIEYAIEKHLVDLRTGLDPSPERSKNKKSQEDF